MFILPDYLNDDKTIKVIDNDCESSDTNPEVRALENVSCGSTCTSGSFVDLSCV